MIFACGFCLVGGWLAGMIFVCGVCLVVGGLPGMFFCVRTVWLCELLPGERRVWLGAGHMATSTSAKLVWHGQQWPM